MGGVLLCWQFLKIEGALSGDELRQAQAAADSYIDAAMESPDSLPPGFRQDPGDGRRFENGFAFDRCLERLATHAAIWPVVVELTGGKPHFSSGTLQVILPTAPGASNEGPRSRVLGLVPAVSWPWVPAWGSLEPPRRDSENARKTGRNGATMGEILPTSNN